MIPSKRAMTIKQRLTDALKPNQLEIIDESAAHAGHAGAGTGMGHYAIKIASSQFAGKGTLQCHRLVYDALGDLMQTDIHAIKIQILK